MDAGVPESRLKKKKKTEKTMRFSKPQLLVIMRSRAMTMTMDD